MAKNGNESSRDSRYWLAISTLGFSALAIIVLALIIINKPDTNSEGAMQIFNVVLPVFASWVGTILAFYFGRESFESANQEIRKLVDKVSPEERAKELVTVAMRGLNNMVHFKIPAGKSDQDIKLSEIYAKFGGAISRMPIIDAEKKPKYMIHQSRMDRYFANGGNQTDSLETFITNQKGASIEYGLDNGFVVVAEQSTLADAKIRMEQKPSCQDIFITKGGSADEPLTGWISNLRLSTFLEAK